MSPPLVFTNGLIFTATGQFQDENAQLESTMVVDNTEISYVGDENDPCVRKCIEDGASVINLENKVVTPGIIESHGHFLLFGTHIRKLDISPYKTLQEIRASIAQYAKAHPDLPRILCRGWHQNTTKSAALASDLDDLDPRPIYIESEDLHSTWCNTAAINELPLERLGEADTPTAIPRDDQGNPTGLLAEMAQLIVVWHHQIAVLSMEEKLLALETVFQIYIDSGYTGFIDLAMDNVLWEALQEYKKRKDIPLHIAAHWLVTNGCSMAELTRRIDVAIEMHDRFHPSKDPEFCIIGVKLILDGVVDGCTAAVSDPFPGHKGLVPPVWSLEEASFTVKRVTDAGMQAALHAVGDVAIKLAIDAIEQGGGKGKRHRMEHIEFPSEEDIRKMGELGIIAAIQPGHSDPFAVRTYEQMVGSRLWERAFPYKDFVGGNAVIAIGTDAPSADHLPLPTLYNATTRKSARVPTMTTTTHAHQAVALAQAMHAFTASGAYARFAEDWTGSLRPGKRADFVVIDTEWKAETLLKAKVLQTWSKGKKVFQG